MGGGDLLDGEPAVAQVDEAAGDGDPGCVGGGVWLEVEVGLGGAEEGGGERGPEADEAGRARQPELHRERVLHAAPAAGRVAAGAAIKAGCLCGHRGPIHREFEELVARLVAPAAPGCARATPVVVQLDGEGCCDARLCGQLLDGSARHGAGSGVDLQPSLARIADPREDGCGCVGAACCGVAVVEPVVDLAVPRIDAACVGDLAPEQVAPALVQRSSRLGSLRFAGNARLAQQRLELEHLVAGADAGPQHLEVALMLAPEVARAPHPAEWPAGGVGLPGAVEQRRVFDGRHAGLADRRHIVGDAAYAGPVPLGAAQLVLVGANGGGVAGKGAAHIGVEVGGREQLAVVEEGEVALHNRAAVTAGQDGGERAVGEQRRVCEGLRVEAGEVARDDHDGVGSPLRQPGRKAGAELPLLGEDDGRQRQVGGREAGLRHLPRALHVAPPEGEEELVAPVDGGELELARFDERAHAVEHGGVALTDDVDRVALQLEGERERGMALQDLQQRHDRLGDDAVLGLLLGHVEQPRRGRRVGGDLGKARGSAGHILDVEVEEAQAPAARERLVALWRLWAGGHPGVVVDRVDRGVCAGVCASASAVVEGVCKARVVARIGASGARVGRRIAASCVAASDLCVASVFTTACADGG